MTDYNLDSVTAALATLKTIPDEDVQKALAEVSLALKRLIVAVNKSGASHPLQ